MNKKTYIIISIIVIIAIALVIGLIIYNNAKSNDNLKEDIKINQEENNENEEDESMQAETQKNPIVTMKIKNYGTVKMELYPKYAPNTVANFVKLVKEGFYNGLTFHRVVANFVVQGGGRDETESFTIPGEFSINNYKRNTLRHEKGVLSMARADYSMFGDAEVAKKGYDSASTQFFIMLEDHRSLDGYYAAFGKVIEGMETVEKMGELETDSLTDKPLNPPVIESMTVETFGVDYGEPTRYEPFDINAYVNR